MVKEWNMFEGRIRCGLGTTRLLDNWDTDEWTVHLPNFIHTPNYDKDANLGFPKEPSRYLIVEAFVKNWFENRENPSNNWIKEGKRIGRHGQSRLEELFTPDIVRTTIAKQIISSCKIIRNK